MVPPTRTPHAVALASRNGQISPAMPPESVTYVINGIIGAILAALMTPHWRSTGTAANLRWWIVAAWTMTVADFLFALRPGLPHWVGRFFPTLLVTVGHAMLLHAAWLLAQRAPRPRLLTLGIALHGAALAGFLLAGDASGWRPVVNGIVWGGLSVFAALTLASAPERIRRAMAVPAIVLGAQGVFHAARTLLATQVAVSADASGNALLQALGDLEVSLFMVALFTSVLVAFLRLSGNELRSALSDVEALSQLLPLCAWCRKVRSDDGYWGQLEQFLESRNILVTHGICESCASDQTARTGH